MGDLADAIHRLLSSWRAGFSALAAEQSILSALVETLNEGVIAISPAHEVVRINQTGRRLLSIDAPYPFGMDFLPREVTLRSAISLALNGTETEPEEVVIGDNTLSLTARPLVGRRRSGRAVRSDASESSRRCAAILSPTSLMSSELRSQ